MVERLCDDCNKTLLATFEDDPVGGDGGSSAECAAVAKQALGHNLLITCLDYSPHL